MHSGNGRVIRIRASVTVVTKGSVTKWKSAKAMEFAKVFQSSVEEGLVNTLGSNVMETLKGLLDHSFKAYAEKPAELHRELSRFFGSAAITLEKMITKELFQRLHLRYSNELEFETKVDLARRDMISSQRGSD